MPTHKVYSKYAGIGNDVLQTDRISLKAKGLLGYLVSKPEGWQFSSVRIANEIKESKKTIQSVLRELELDGLLLREKLANGRVLYHVYSSYELLKEPKVDNDSEQELLRAKMGHISKNFLIEKKRERGSRSASLRSDSVKGISKGVGAKSTTNGFDKSVEHARFMEALRKPGFMRQFVRMEMEGAWITEREILLSAKKCFAFQCKKQESPNDWGATLYLWLSNERWE